MGRPAWLTTRPVAHRGYHDRDAGRIENTIAAAEAAIARGFAVECDLQLTRDDVAIVFHDDTLDRLTATTGRVSTMTLAALKAIPLAGTTATIPTLEEFLATIAGRVPLFVEFKSTFDRNRRLEEVAAPALAAYAGPLAVMSFDPDSLIALRRLLPSLPRGMVADRFTDEEWSPIPPLRRLALRHLAAAPRVMPSFVAWGVHDLPADPPLLLRHLGVPLLTWTVRTLADRKTAARYADQIIFEGFDPEATDTASPVAA
ncbi:MAG: glycerophosphodiester phosphodiesterase [Bauldia sp.]|nr:glycerophosphodiester phosphodiesterase [Bauldia sp.]